MGNCPPCVTVQPLREFRQLSAVDSHDVALAVSPFARASAPAVTRPAISAAIDDGDLPYCSSQRSVVSGPDASDLSKRRLPRVYSFARRPVDPVHLVRLVARSRG